MNRFDVAVLPNLASIALIDGLPRDIVNIEDKTRSNPLRWSGQFSPQLIEALLRKYSSPGLVADPFAGSGTVLLESARLGLPAYGAELNPAAFILARIYSLCALNLKQRSELVKNVLTAMTKKRFAHFLTDREAAARFIRCSEGALRLVLETLFVLTDATDSEGKVQLACGRLLSLIRSLPYAHEISVSQGDARRLPLADGAVSTVVTSPPYINVFNYHQQYRPSVEYLGWDVLSVARSEIGSNRKHRQNRFLTVVQYCLDMAACIQEMSRITMADANIVLIVGRESNVLGVPFSNSAIVAQLALHCRGLRVIASQERFFTNRFGQRIYEDILHIKRAPGGYDISLTDTREVARAVLTAGITDASPNARPFLNDAIDRISDISESATYEAVS